MHCTWEQIEALARGAYRLLLYGPPGTGKTYAAYEAARILGKPLYNVTLTDETPAAELRGHYVPQGNKWTFRYGPATLAYTEGAMLLLDEIDKASQDCLDFLHGLLNDPLSARITLPTGEMLTPTNGFQVIATMNGEYDDLKPSLKERFAIAVEVTEPNPKAIASLPEDLQGAVELFVEGEDRTATLRRWQAFASLREIPEIGVEVAARAVFAHRAPELIDAITFREPDPTPTGDHHPEHDVCTCASCVRDRAWAWHSHNFDDEEVEFDDSDDTYRCPASCGSWHSTEEQALMCCYDDDDWVAYCYRNGLSLA